MLVNILDNIINTKDIIKITPIENICTWPFVTVQGRFTVIDEYTFPLTTNPPIPENVYKRVFKIVLINNDSIEISFGQRDFYSLDEEYPCPNEQDSLRAFNVIANFRDNLIELLNEDKNPIPKLEFNLDV